MILKKITMAGFKSFADKVDIILNKGITALVGPNGCGKSNVVDAIRWVLGEQSIKVLRGGKSEDVIFNGCDTRKPSGMAEVSLTFDNTSGRLPIDFNEVTITRRLFRSGESVYLINKTQCRLKDIHQLFMDTGIGTSSYSIIEQGEMDWIINAKPIERREIFEEAAGITKYKIKKKEAERKLKYADENLVRLHDIILELDTQKNSVGRQAAKAKRFKKLTGELEFLDSQYTLRKHNNIESQIIENKNELNNNETALLSSKEELNNIEQNHHREITDINDLDRELKELTEKKYEIDSKIQQIKQGNEYKSARIKDAESRLTNENQNKESYEKKSIELETLLSNNIKEQADVKAAFEEKKELVQNHLDKTNFTFKEIEGKKQFITDYRNKLEENAKKSTEKHNQIFEFNILEKNFNQQIEKYYDEISDLQLNLNFEEEEFSKIKDEVTNLKANYESISKNILEKDASLIDTQKWLTSLESQMTKLSSEISDKNSRKEALSDLKNSYDGFFSGVRAIMLNKSEDPSSWNDVIGVLPDIMKVKSGFEVAAEAALGSRIQNIVVETGETAKKAIAFLKKHKLGRVTFLPLDLITSRQNEKQVPSDNRIIGKLLDFINFEPRFQSVMDSLIGNFIVVNNIDDAISLKRSGITAFNIITLDGELIAQSGAISGGELKSGVQGIFSRENEIVDLAESLSKLRDILISKNTEREQLKHKIDILSNELENLKIKKSTAASDLQHSEKDLQKAEFQTDSIRKRIEMFYGELENLNTKKEKIITERESLKEDLSSSTSEHASIKESISKYEKDLEESYELLTAGKELLAREQSSLSNLEEKLLSFDNKIKEIKKEINEQKEWISNLSSQQKEQKTFIESLTLDIAKNEEELIKAYNEEKILSESIIKTSEKLSNLKIQNEDFEEKRKSLQSSIEKYHENNTSLKVQIAEFEGKLNNLREHIYSKYQKRIEDIENKINEIEIPLEEVPLQIDDLENKIRNLGSVNLGAIEELEQLEERFTFLSEQEKDLNHAKVQLHEVIQKINVKATNLFEETFNKVKVYFNDIFTQLFEGGKAELKLLEADDILEAGIDIVARPPGKNPQTISLLSGGEKALTATSLLFALFKVKPSPFCFIDELDAPLDDTNISRFTKLLTYYVKETQFIVITHSKTTLKVADLLYGVTQPEKGISTFLSFKFIEEDLDHLLKDPDFGKSLPKSRFITIKEDDELVSQELPIIRPLQLHTPKELAEIESKNRLNENQHEKISMLIPTIPEIVINDETTIPATQNELSIQEPIK